MVRANLLDSGTTGLAGQVKKACTGIPKQWTLKDLTVLENETMGTIDRSESRTCADSALIYVDHIESRDKALMGTVKK